MTRRRSHDRFGCRRPDEILAGHPGISQRAALVPAAEQSVPIIVIEELIRGRLNSIRQAEAGKSKLTIERAYELFEATLHAFRQIRVLPYTSAAEALFQQWRSQRGVFNEIWCNILRHRRR